MEITLGAARRRPRRLRARWRERRPRRDHLLSLDELLRYRLLQQMGAARGPWAAERALPVLPSEPTPDYELMELELSAREAEARAGRDAAGRDAAAAGALVLALAALVLLARALCRCFRRRSTKESAAAAPAAPAARDPPPPYSERAPRAPRAAAPRDDPPPPYSACYVALRADQPPQPPVGCPDQPDRDARRETSEELGSRELQILA